MNIPNALTVVRIALIPVFVGLYYVDAPWTNEAVTALFVAASATDWLDGYLARRLDQASAFGAFLDPVADKLMVAAALVVLVQADPRPHIAIIAIIIIGREIAVSALREWMAELGQRSRVRVAFLGKFKTVMQMVSISLLLYRDDIGGFAIYDFGLVCLYVAAALTLWSMVDYLRAAWPMMGMDVPEGQTDHRRPDDG
jgi:CDP-diacylglycerol--glycerol-3-phosphate 3-phosphatidyltransferase